MTFYPVLLSLKKRKILLVGGGRIAADKLERILLFSNDVTVLAPETSPRMLLLIQNNGLQHVPRRYAAGDCSGYGLIIAAVDDLELQREIHSETRGTGALCNLVDDDSRCDVIFPAVIKRGDLTVSCSTAGSAPALSKHLRRALDQLLPAEIEPLLAELKALRRELPKGAERRSLMNQKAAEFIDTHLLGER